MARKEHFCCTLQELRQRALEAWKEHSEEYRSLIPKYQSLLSKKRWLKANERGYKSMPLRKLNKSILEELEHIPFFDITSENEAIDYIGTLESKDLRYLLMTIDHALDSCAFRTIKARIGDYEFQIRNFKLRSSFGYDPTYPVSSGHRSYSRGPGKHSSGIDE